MIAALLEIRAVYQSCIDTGQSSDPVRARQVASGHIGFRRVSVGTLFWHDGTRQGSTGRSTVLYRCTIDVRTPWARHGVPTGHLGPRRDPTEPRRTSGGTVGPRLIGASPVWAARSSYWRSQGYCRRQRRKPTENKQDARHCKLVIAMTWQCLANIQMAGSR